MILTSEHRCPKHNETHWLEVDATSELEYGLQRWKAGEFIQDALPMLTADQRELLMTGTCQEAWDEMFPPEED